ncbi:hypothetical protein QNH23_07550 [Siminovitchia fortis]|nr:hypothetical protein [Siminovitchia fortis]WHY83218.1 hypothetical protein QNH23_07550 [Siminovitchia fortis]
MRELAGHCRTCGKEIYCENGFFNGVILKDGKIICFNCEEKKPEK